MSVVQNPFIGRARQKAGGMVFSTWKGINVLKTKPLTVANPKTDKQLMRRSALSQIVAIARQITAALQLGFKEQAVFKSAFNAFTGYNLRNGFNYTLPPAATPVPSAFLVAQGTISLTALTGFVADASLNNIVINWPTSASQPGQSSADVAVIALFNQTENKWLATNTSSPRNTGTATIAAGPLTINDGDTVMAYFFFYNVANRKSSDSSWSSTVVIP